MEKKTWMGKLRNDVKNAQKRQTNWARDQVATHTGAMAPVILEIQQPPGLLLSRFVAMKQHKWRGRYMRILCITDEGVGTQDINFALTNFWPWVGGEVSDVQLGDSATGEVVLVTGEKREVQAFSANDHVEVLSRLHNVRAAASPSSYTAHRFEASKVTREGQLRQVLVEIVACEFRQLDPASNKVLSRYPFKTIKGVAHLPPSLEAENADCFIIYCGAEKRGHIFAAAQWRQLTDCLGNEMKRLLGLTLGQGESQQAAEEILQQRQELNYADEVAGVRQFEVYKKTPRYEAPLSRVLVLSQGTMAEVDASSRALISARCMSDVFAIVRNQQDPQWLSIEYEDGSVREFMSTAREALAACLLDTVKTAKAAGAGQAGAAVPTDSGREATTIVRDSTTNNGWLTSGRASACDSEVEGVFLNLMQQAEPLDPSLITLLLEFGAHRLESDSHSTNQKKRSTLIEKLFQLLQTFHTESGGGLRFTCSDGIPDTTRYTALLKAIQSLMYTQSGYQAIALVSGVPSMLRQALEKDDFGVIYQTIMLMVSMVKGPPGADPADITSNKRLLLTSASLREAVITRLKEALEDTSGQLIVQGIMTFIAYSTIKPYSETTQPDDYKAVLEDLASMQGALFQIFLHPSGAVVRDAGNIMEVITRDSPADVRARIQSAALQEGALLKHLHLSLFANTSSERVTSRTLVAMWCESNISAQGLLDRCLPLGLLLFLDAPPLSKADMAALRESAESHSPKSKGGSEPSGGLSSSQLMMNLRSSIHTRRRQSSASGRKNWNLFWHMALQDHSRADLIWNANVREELRLALEEQLSIFVKDRGQATQGAKGALAIAWNHFDFDVVYPSLEAEKKVGNYYLRLLMNNKSEEALAEQVLAEVEFHGDAERFFNDFYCRSLIEADPDVISYCLHAITIVYKHHFQSFPLFHNTPQLVQWLKRENHAAVRDHVLCLLRELVRAPYNAKHFLRSDGISVVVELMNLVQWQTAQEVAAPVQGSQLLITGGTATAPCSDWYYKNGESGAEVGPMTVSELEEAWEATKLTKDTFVRTQDDRSWTALRETRLLRWRLCSTGRPHLSSSKRAEICLDVFLTLLQMYPVKAALTGARLTPMHLAKRELSDENQVLTYVAQVLLTGNPTLVDKACQLLLHICQDNPETARKLYQTGCFYFMLMYAGSNVVEIFKLVKETHVQQTFQGHEQMARDMPLSSRSILGTLLPEALLYMLENSTAEQFAEAFVGEHDTPEVIWNSDMREHLMREVACHTSDFRWRIRDNPLINYEYIQMPNVEYSQLRTELWCHSYYLRNLCNTTKFMDWDVRSPVEVLQALLATWRRLLKGQQDEMSYKLAMSTMEGLIEEGYTVDKLKKAYRRLAIKYHPDKNPEGRVVFDKVQIAFQFLAKQLEETQVASNQGLGLVLDAHAILYTRYAEVLSPYKYAGYHMLVDQLKTKENILTAERAPILSKSLLVAFVTARVSPVNGQEFCKNEALTHLEAVLHHTICTTRVMSAESSPKDDAVMIAARTIQIIILLSKATETRDKVETAVLGSMSFVTDICRCLEITQATLLMKHSLRLVTLLSRRPGLQSLMFEAGVLFRLIPMLLTFDYTLDEEPVDWGNETSWNAQQVKNSLAGTTVKTLHALTGHDDYQSEPCELVRATLTSLLTPGLSKMMASAPTRDFLAKANANVESDDLIWGSENRDELATFCEEQIANLQAGTHDPAAALSFTYSSVRNELQIYDIYIRVYLASETPRVDRPEEFCDALLAWLTQNTPANAPERRAMHVEQAIRAAAVLLAEYPSLAPKVGRSGILPIVFNLILARESASHTTSGLHFLEAIVSTKDTSDFVSSAPDYLADLFVILMDSAGLRLTILKILAGVCSTSKVTLECLNRGFILYGLHMIVNQSDKDVAVASVSAVRRVAKDAVHGPKVQIAMQRLLPAGAVSALCDGGGDFSLNQNYNTPELIWNSTTFDKFKERVAAVAAGLCEQQRAALKGTGNGAADVPGPAGATEYKGGDSIEYEELADLTYIGGVYLDQYLKEPQYNLRNAKAFIEALLDRYFELATVEGDQGTSESDAASLSKITTAIVCVCRVKAALGDHIANLGYVPRLLAARQNEMAHKCCLKLLHQLGESAACVQKLAQAKCVSLLFELVELGAEARLLPMQIFIRMLGAARPTDSAALVQQAIDLGMVRSVMGVLSPVSTAVEGRSSTSRALAAQSERAQLEHATAQELLKTLCSEATHGEAVAAELESYPAWAEYRDQDHALFVPSSGVEEQLLSIGN